MTDTLIIERPRWLAEGLLMKALAVMARINGCRLEFERSKAGRIVRLVPIYVRAD